MKEAKVVVERRHGIHLQPAAKLVRLIKGYPNAAVSLVKDGKALAADSVLNLLSLNLVHNTEITLRVEGHGQEKCLEALKNFFAEADD